MIATSDFLTAGECIKFIFGRDSALNPARGAYDTPPDSLVIWGENTQLPPLSMAQHLDCRTPPSFKSCIHPWHSALYKNITIHLLPLERILAGAPDTIYNKPKNHA